MNALHMVEIRPDVEALWHFLHGQGLVLRDGDEDLGYGVHAWLKAAFGDMAPRPWRLFYDGRRPPRILGYSEHGADGLRSRLEEFADPSTFAVCPEPDRVIAGKKMPVWRIGRRLAFEVQACPVGRKAGTGIEKDVFLIRADGAEKGTLRRDAVYTAWAVERFERDDAAKVEKVALAGFRLVRLMRRTQRADGNRQSRSLLRPSALLRGELVVRDPDGFSELLRSGLGRHRAFGYGMILLGPAP